MALAVEAIVSAGGAGQGAGGAGEDDFEPDWDLYAGMDAEIENSMGGGAGESDVEAVEQEEGKGEAAVEEEEKVRFLSLPFLAESSWPVTLPQNPEEELHSCSEVAETVEVEVTEEVHYFLSSLISACAHPFRSQVRDPPDAAPAENEELLDYEDVEELVTESVEEERARARAREEEGEKVRPFPFLLTLHAE
jgi:hypothetical protein